MKQLFVISKNGTSFILIVVVGFYLLARILGECSTIQFPPALFFFFFFEVVINSRSLIPLIIQDQSTVAQRAETNVAECSLTSCVSARFLIGFHSMPRQRHSQPTLTSLGQGCMRV